MDKEQLSKLLIEQQDKGKALLSLISNMHESRNDFGDGMAVFGIEDLFYVPEDELDEFTNKFEGWKSYVQELLETQFGGDDQYVYDWNTKVVTYISKREPILQQLKKNVNKGLSLIESFLERLDIHYHDDEGRENKIKQTNSAKPPMVFISHAELDKEFANEIVTLLEFIGVKGKENLLCTSVDGYRIPLGHDIIEYLREMFNSKNLFVIILHSHNYYTRTVCLNEMGAAWALKTKYFSVLAPDFNFDEMTGVVNKRDVAIKIGADDCVARVNQLKSELLKFFGLPEPDEDRWPHYRDKFIANSLLFKGTKNESKQSLERKEAQICDDSLVALSESFRVFEEKDGCFPFQIDVKFTAQKKDVYFKSIKLLNNKRTVELDGFGAENDILNLRLYLKLNTLNVENIKREEYRDKVGEIYHSSAIYVEDYKLDNSSLETMSFHGIIGLRRQMDGYDDFQTEGWELYVTYNTNGELTIPLNVKMLD